MHGPELPIKYFNDAALVRLKEQERQLIAQQVSEYLANGQKIESLSSFETSKVGDRSRALWDEDLPLG